MEDKYLGKRVGATLIDYTVVFLFTVLYIVGFGEHGPNGSYSIHGLSALVPMAFWFVYIVVAEGFLGGTVGHQLFRLKVVSIDGSPVWFGQTFLRRICDALEISWCFGFIAFVIAANMERGQRLGDLMAKTRVIRKTAPEEKIEFDFEQAH